MEQRVKTAVEDVFGFGRGEHGGIVTPYAYGKAVVADGVRGEDLADEVHTATFAVEVIGFATVRDREENGVPGFEGAEEDRLCRWGRFSS